MDFTHSLPDIIEVFLAGWKLGFQLLDRLEHQIRSLDKQPSNPSLESGIKPELCHVSPGIYYKHFV